MAGASPIQLGSAVSGWTFESGSSVEESPSGIQSCTVNALWPDGSSVLNNLPSAGASVSVIEGSGYIPSSFLLDYSESGPSIDYLDGRIARAKFKFKRQDPNRIGRTFATIESDSVINYKSDLSSDNLTFISFGGSTGQLQSFLTFGFPEPVATLMYNSTSQPSLGSGGLTQLYVLPGSPNAQGFPAVPSIFNPISIPVRAGGSVTYYNPTTSAFITVGPVMVDTAFNFVNEYRPNVLGWQLQKIKAKAIANGAFYDAEEEWRISYIARGSVLVGTVPPLPP